MIVYDVYVTDNFTNDPKSELAAVCPTEGMARDTVQAWRIAYPDIVGNSPVYRTRTIAIPERWDVLGSSGIRFASCPDEEFASSVAEAWTGHFGENCRIERVS